MTDDLDYSQLNHGIREVVRLLRSHGFETTDSGDGVTNVAAGMEGALAIPHVHCRIPASNQVRCARWAVDALEERCVVVTAGMVQTTYDPVTSIALLSVYGVDDAALAAARKVSP
jgi:hypothetical protein